MASSDYSVWVQFFKNATIAPQFANLYATKFIENRIRFDMLNDLNKELLNEMGINAVGDCLCILKHTKALNLQIEETKKELILGETSASSASRKRCDVAKRVIETYLSDSAESPPKTLLSEKSAPPPTITATSSSTLSADLMSRLNFAAATSASSSSTTQIKHQPQVIKFNEDSLNHQSKVSSTTADDDLDLLANRKMLNLKRKLNHQEHAIEAVSEDDDDDDEDEYEASSGHLQPAGATVGKPLEYRGLLKTDKKLTISISNHSSTTTTRTLAGDPMQKPSVKSRLSKVPKEESPNGKIIRLNKSLPPTLTNESLNASIQLSLNNIKAEMTTPPAPPAKTSVFKRIKTSSEVENLKIRVDTSSSDQPGRAAVRLLGDMVGGGGGKTSKSSPVKAKIISLVKKPAAIPTPISYDFPRRELEDSTANNTAVVRSLTLSTTASNNKTILNRLRFPNK